MIFALLLKGVLCDYLQEYQQLESSSTCPKYSCAPSSIKKPFSNSCVMEYSSTQYYLWQCPEESTANYCNTTSFSCQVPPETTKISYVGEPCTVSSDCYLSSCLKGTCRGTAQNKTCVSHEQCDIGLRCNSGNFTCQPQIPVGKEGCRSYLDCVNWATCNLTYSSQRGVCIDYSSLPIGSYVTDCVGSFSYMCASGYCIKKYTFASTGICATAPVSNSTMPKICSSNTDCPGNSNGMPVTSACVCGYNKYGNKYCNPFIGDLPGKTMLFSWSKALRATGQCNTARRSSDNCMKMVGLLTNTTHAALGFYYYPLYVLNDICIEEIYNKAYYVDYSPSIVLPLIMLALSFY